LDISDRIQGLGGVFEQIANALQYIASANFVIGTANQNIYTVQLIRDTAFAETISVWLHGRESKFRT